MSTIRVLPAKTRRVVITLGLALGIAFLSVPAFAGVASATTTSGSSGYDYPSVSGQPTVGAPSEQQLTANSGRHRNDYLERQLYQPAAVPHVSTTVQQSR